MRQSVALPHRPSSARPAQPRWPAVPNCPVCPFYLLSPETKGELGEDSGSEERETRSRERGSLPCRSWPPPPPRIGRTGPSECGQWVGAGAAASQQQDREAESVRQHQQNHQNPSTRQPTDRLFQLLFTGRKRACLVQLSRLRVTCRYLPYPRVFVIRQGSSTPVWLRYCTQGTARAQTTRAHSRPPSGQPQLNRQPAAASIASISHPNTPSAYLAWPC